MIVPNYIRIIVTRSGLKSSYPTLKRFNMHECKSIS